MPYVTETETNVKERVTLISDKKGVSALQIQRMMGFGSYKTAQMTCHKIRAALIAPETKLGGIAEMDSTLMGGKDINRHFNKRTHYPNVVARVLKRVTSQEMLTFVNETVSNKVSLLVADSWAGYSDYLHRFPARNR